MVPKAFEAGYPNTSGFRKVVKVTIYIKKKEGMSDADFVDYYNNNHAQHRDRKMIQDIMHGKAKLMDYDAMCTFVFPDYLALAEFLYDKDGAALNSDHENFMDDSQMKMMVGDEYMLIDDGQKVG